MNSLGGMNTPLRTLCLHCVREDILRRCILAFLMTGEKDTITALVRATWHNNYPSEKKQHILSS